jgi:hypothetical protein
MAQTLDGKKYSISINNWQIAAPVKECIPSLPVVSWQQSVLPAILNRNTIAAYFSATDPSYAAKPLNETVLSTATGTFIAIGVNRWASLYIVNPKAFIETNDIPNYYYFSTAKSLQDIAGQYFFDYPTVTDDLITISEGSFKTLVKSKIATDPKVMSIMLTNAFGYTELQVEEIAYDDRKDLCARYLWDNLLTLQRYINNNFATWNTPTFTINPSVSADTLNLGSILA